MVLAEDKQRLGNYTVVRKLGEGGMGAVYEGIQDGLNRRVALKLLTQRLLKDSTYLERFQREAQGAAALNHPNIVTVYEIGQDRGTYFFSMEFVDGTSLGNRISKERRLPVSDALEITSMVASALDYAWREAGLVHRDIKPDNIMRREDGTLALIDFGAVRDDALLPSGKLTITGTPGYMAPEQVRGVTSAASDVWAMGALAVTMFTRESPSQFIESEGTFAWRDAVESQVSQGCLALLEAMLQPSPGERIEDGAALAAHIEEVLEGKTSLVPSTTSHAASRDKRTRAPGTAPRASTELVAPAPSYLATPRRQRGESLFGLYILAGAGVVGVMPCVVFFVGLSEAAMGMSTLLLLMIFMIPFIPAEEQTDPSRLLEE